MGVEGGVLGEWIQNDLLATFIRTTRHFIAGKSCH